MIRCRSIPKNSIMENKEALDPINVAGVIACILAFVLIVWYNSSKRSQPQEASPPLLLSSGEEAAQPASGAAEAVSPAPFVSPGASSRIYDPKQPFRMPQSAALELGIPGYLQASLDPQGGGFTAVKLLQHNLSKTHQVQEHPAKVVLGHYDYPFLALNDSGSGLELGEPGYGAADNGGYSLRRLSKDQSLEISETWRPKEGSEYELEYVVTLRNLGADRLSLAGLRLEAGALPPSLSNQRKAKVGESSGGVSYGSPALRRAKNLKIRDVGSKMNAERQAQLMQTPANWLAVHSKYFLFYVRFNQNESFVGLEANMVAGLDNGLANGNQPERLHGRAILPPLSLEPGAEKRWEISAYVGPKDIRRLHAIGGNLENIMEMDRFFFWNVAWMGWLSRLLLTCMVWISKLFPPSVGYGMGIVGITLVVKTLFWPLNHRSTVSMRKMSALNPELKKLRERYKDDPQKMYRKQQELFKANKVSQLGGCLPMLCQIPVFFALFNTFRNAIELRQAGFLWAVDLSMPDDLFFSLAGLPIRPFALMMGATMYLQQKLTPSPDPNQAKMMNMMSVVFIFMFYGMPSALTLYMSVNQLLSIAQMLFIRRLEARKGKTNPVIVTP